MADAQNERTGSGSRRRGRRGRGAKNERSPEQASPEEAPIVESVTAPVVVQSSHELPLVRPADIAPQEERTEEYCVHHMASMLDSEPIQVRKEMTTLRHLAVDTFGGATLYCDCLHNGPHEWPPSMQKLETAIELDQFLTDSTNEA